MKLRYAYIETTNYCNLKCITCNREDVIGPLSHMSIDKFYSLMDKLKDHPIQEAKFMGMGEPFLHPNFAARKIAVRITRLPLLEGTWIRMTVGPGVLKALKKLFEGKV